MNRDIARWTIDAVAWITGLFLSLFLIADAMAGERPAAPVANSTWQAECGSCHVAYPPRLLAAPAWRRIMQGLDRHFGVDASVDAASAATIGGFLEANAQSAANKRYDQAATRITETRWFRHEHGEVAAATWKRPDVRSAANCAACHAQADRGIFSERQIRSPGV
jgi:hypothetical protein